MRLSPRHRQLVAPACVGIPEWVVGWDDDARSPPLYRLSVSGRDHQPCHMALFPLSAWSPHGGGVARCPRHRRQPRNRAAVGAQIWPAVSPIRSAVGFFGLATSGIWMRLV